MAPRWTRSFALAGALALTLAACGGGGDGDSSSSAASTGGSADGPTFVAATLDGGELSSSAFDGKDTVLWFWAPWCTTCRGEAPDVMATAAAFDGEVEIVGVAGRGEVAEMEDFVSDTDTGSLTHVVDEDGAIWTDYEVVAQPAFAFIDDDGSVETYTGALGEAALTERIEQLTSN